MNEFKKIKYIFIDNQKTLNTIVLPGFLQTSRTYQNLYSTISKYSNIYIIEFPGFGVTDKLDYSVNLNYYVNYLNDFIHTLNLQNVCLFGHSFGGRVIIKYEATFNKSHALILMDSAGIKKRSIKTKIKIWKYKVQKKLFKTLKLTKKLKKLITCSGSSDYKNLDDISKKTFNQIINEDLTKYLHKIHTNTLLIWGELDKETDIKMGVKMNKLIKNSGLAVVKGVGHFPHLENPYIVNNVLNSYYKSLRE